ncbi:MAG: VanZ family protein [Planctomycetes bacterium]|nr:VanZ family protein [Planctomycetota bacterium]
MSHPSKTLARPWMARLLAVATVAYTGVLVFATHHPRPEELLGPNPPSDKTLHFIAYAVLAGLASATWLTARRTASRGIATLAIALAAFGAVDEITQPFFRRHAEPLDWVYDCIGIAIGIAAVVAVVALARRVARPQ